MTKMYCSNCNVAYFNSGVSESEEIMCENGHFLCPNCYASSKTKCIKCGGRLHDCIQNIPLTNWTLEMIFDWLEMNKKTTSNSRDDKFDGEFGVLRDGESMNMLFSRSKSFDAESEDNNNNNLNILSSKENQDDFLEEIDSFPKNVENSQPMENNSNFMKKVTRQNLVDQMRDQIRGQSDDFFDQIDSFSKYVGNSHPMESNSNRVKNDTRQNLVDQIRGQSKDFFDQIDSFPKNVGNSHPMQSNPNRVKNDTRQNLDDQISDEIRISSNEFFEQKNSFANSQPFENNSNLIKKDTPQNLLDQMKDEIGKKVKEQIYNLYKNDPRTLIKPVEKYIRVKESKTIGVSTESEPNIVPRSQPSKERIVEVIDLKPNIYIRTPPPSHEYSVMNFDTRHKINPKPSSSGVEEQHQESSETVLDSGLDMILSDKTADKFSEMPKDKLDQKMSSICYAKETQFSDEYGSQFKNDKKSNDFLFISNSSRASYSPLSCLQISSTTQPKPQFQLIANATKPLTQIVDAISLYIPRSPVICPISSCQQACFVSDITRHVAVYHTNVPMERIVPRQCKNFFLDPKLIHFGSIRCQMLLLVKDKIKNLGHEKRFKDFIPVLVMSTKVSTLELCCKKSETENAVMKNTDGNGLVMIWLTGLMPPQLPIYFSMTVWARTGNMPSCHIVHSGQLYSIRNSQNARDIQESGQRLLLSRSQIDLLTSNGRNMLELQIAIN